jgi:hypothetical protein
MASFDLAELSALEIPGIPLWRWLTPEGVTPCLPVPHFNILTG